ncbi:MerR family transcriptional regulator [Amycolatopsis suaedae]|uniref:MerR family transcriptional regulator n=1 Tax=Amycolatopsis suaedae TaxID=2510978 RepID=A0A4V2EL28_9PSEU|nr:MerR family transcriptional regulator [Amycolatopsis suaedae]RZQ60115.1 MerR family transcriptional regulator [Amycolatopsis suaedae]
MSTGRMAVTIGEAAALFGLAPSTLRYWERCGVLTPPPRRDGRRVYDEADLRRIGVAYLCCVTGMMPLDRAAVVTSGAADLEVWQETVREQIVEADRAIRQLTAARQYLAHLLSCESDDMASCPVLDGELIARTPRGRVTAPDLVTAARAREGDEMAVDGDERCAWCGAPLQQPERGRRRRFCSHACRQRGYRRRTVIEST